VNATSLGMEHAGRLDMPLAQLDAGCVVADLVYVPLVTPLLAAARARGLPTVDGLGMLLHQAVPGFEKWFGVRPEVTDELRDLLVADIEGKLCWSSASPAPSAWASRRWQHACVPSASAYAMPTPRSTSSTRVL